MPIAQSLLPQFGAQEVSADYSESVKMVVEIEVRQVADFTQTIINKSAAKVQITPLDKL
jgi:putative IMPACT (imprinted ancient) family translation regulator